MIIAFFIAIHFILSLALILLIVLSKTSANVTSGIGPNISNIGSAFRSSSFSFISKLILSLVIIFFCNTIILAFLNYKNNINNSKIPEYLIKQNKEEKEPPLDVPTVPME